MIMYKKVFNFKYWNKATLIILGVAMLWLIIQIGFFCLYGVGHGGDSQRYIRGGQAVLEMRLPGGKAASYMGYNAFVGLFFGLGLGELGVVIGQILLTGVAAVCVFEIARRFYDRRAAVIAALFYIGFLKLHPWNVFILTDSLFISALIIVVYLVLISKRWWQWLLTVIMIGWTSVMRPDGLVLLVALAIYALHRGWRRGNRKLVITIIVLIIIVLIPILYVFGGKLAEHEYLIEHYSLGAVIWSYEPLYLTMPGDLPQEINESNNSLLNVWYFVADKPIFFLRLAGTKLWYFLVHVRPFHAPLHNFLILLTMVPMYWLAVVGWRRLRDMHPIVDFMVILFVLKALIAAVTFADWSGRFLLHVWPMVLILASGPATVLFLKYRKEILRIHHSL